MSLLRLFCGCFSVIDFDNMRDDWLMVIVSKFTFWRMELSAANSLRLDLA